MGNVASAFERLETTPGLVDRETGKPTTEPNPLIRAVRLWFLYKTPPGRWLLSLPFSWWIIGWQHKRLAVWANSPDSKKEIPNLIKTYNIHVDTAERPLGEYATLQEFFARRLKPGLRPIFAPEDDAIAVMPADSRCVVYDTFSAAHRFWIKGRRFSVPRLIGRKEGESHPWENGAIAINRLAPCDCHRLHAAVSGRVIKVELHGRRFMGSEWAATHSVLNVMTENERLVMEIDSEEFGPVVQVMVGASEVGSVVPRVARGQQVRKGDEVAVFGYGGSIMATLLPAHSIQFDDDLRRHTTAGRETRVNYGMSLGRATRQAPAAEAEATAAAARMG